MDSLTLSIISIIINSIGTLIIAVTAFLLRKQIKDTHEWNRRKASQETLDALVTGAFPDLREKLEKEFGCRVWDHRKNYEIRSEQLEGQQKRELEYAVGKLLNMLETLCIKIKNNIVDEDICYDYLGFILIEYKRWSEPYIIDKTKGDPKQLAVFIQYADEWSKRKREEERKKKEVVSSTGKKPM